MLNAVYSSLCTVNQYKWNMKITFDDWVQQGERVAYDEKHNSIPTSLNSGSSYLNVFQKVVGSEIEADHWITMLSGYPDGSYGWVKVEHYLKDQLNCPRLYVEYVGQGDSDKPENFAYSSMERANLVQAHWQHKQIRNTFIVAFDYSSLVVLELLRRQHANNDKNNQPLTKIKKVLLINGGYFYDAHSHPWLTTPFLKTSLGKLSTKMVQKSKPLFLMYLKMIKNMWSKNYATSSFELHQFYKAITHRKGATFMSNAGGFVDEHIRNYRERWDLESIYHEMKDDVTFHIVGSEEDIFEPKQLTMAQHRLGKFGVDIRKIPGGHFSTIEHPALIAELMLELNATL